jgi:hypothetical protein
MTEQETRPSPDELLEQMQLEAKAARRGKI